ncbi:MAG: rhodanese-like domain-containing protein [Candidatus Poseidoniaceae archaeon]|nr:rhodanese-like domain-containing protein [Candidatus Poseidoniaceae archaeon]
MAKTHSPKFLEIVETARASIPECSASDLRTMLADGAPLAVIDVRERHEFQAGHLVGSVHIGKGVLERDIEKHQFADDARLVLYCGGGFRSAIAARSLMDMGYSQAFSLWGGWRAILAEDLETYQE